MVKEQCAGIMPISSDEVADCNQSRANPLLYSILPSVIANMWKTEKE